MSAQAKAVLEAFDALPIVEKETLAAEIFHRLPAASDLTYQALDELADELFCQLDSEEDAAHAGR